MFLKNYHGPCQNGIMNTTLVNVNFGQTYFFALVSTLYDPEKFFAYYITKRFNFNGHCSIVNAVEQTMTNWRLLLSEVKPRPVKKNLR